MEDTDIKPQPGDGIADVVLSSIGWVMISTGERSVPKIDIAAWTPGGRGIVLRSPPLVPFAFKYRGHRISGQ